MRIRQIIIALLILAINLQANAQVVELFHGITLNESLSVAKDKIVPHAESMQIMEVAQPTFPLARNTEVHLVCKDYLSENGKLAEVVFTFADDKLSFIQAYGNAVEALTGKRRDTASNFIHYKAFWKDYLLANPTADKVWILSPEAGHPNLFAWENPYLPINGGKIKTYNATGKVPELVKMGGDLTELRPLLEKASDFTSEMKLDGSDPNAQLQIDCFGIEYAGFPRKFEARFGNDKLNVVWILTGKGEEDRIRQKLIAAYGPILFKNEAWEVFANWQVLLRKDKPEVLLLTEELAGFYKKDYFKQ